jgi:hypothetical protein
MSQHQGLLPFDRRPSADLRPNPPSRLARRGFGGGDDVSGGCPRAPA